MLSPLAKTESIHENATCQIGKLCCLITLGRAKSVGAPNAAAMDLSAQSIQIVQLTRRNLVFSLMMGAAANEEFIFLAGQITDGPQPYFYKGSHFLLILHKEDLSLAALHPLQGLSDVHSICLHEGRLYVVSSGSDEVIALELDGSNILRQAVAWRPAPSAPREDIHHLNTLVSWNGNLIVSGFGQKSGALWSSAENGFLHDITADKRLISGLHQPHSFLPVEDDLWFCESRKQTVRSLYGDRQVQLTGYTRGLANLGGRIAVGVSRGRKRSMSTNLLDNWGSPGGSGGKCGLYWISPETLAVAGFTDLGFCSDEVYEILPVTGFGAWPVLSELAWRDAAIAGFDLASERLRLQYEMQIQDYHSALDRLNTEMCSKIEEANRIIQDLYGKLNEQTQWAQRAVADVEERDRIIRDLQVKLHEQTQCRMILARQAKA